jgi:hypothetical protein
MIGPPQKKRVLVLVGDRMPPVREMTRATAQGEGKKGHFHKALSKEFRRGGFTVTDKDAAFAKLRQMRFEQ